MTQRSEYMLSLDIVNWLMYAKYTLGMEENEATVMWNNKHNVGKKLICECRGEESNKPGTRLFIRNVTNAFADAEKKEGWWNTFTLSEEKVEKGLWLAEVVEYHLDKNGYVNSTVKVIMPVNDVAFHDLFSETAGTWNSSAWWLMMVVSGAFLSEYKFSSHGIIHDPNFDELIDKFPIFKDLPANEIGEKALYMYLNGEITIKEIEECLDTPTDWERLVKNISSAVLCGDTKRLYGEKYPLFAEKVSHNVENGESSFIHENAVDYIRRQMRYYDELVRDGKIEPVVGDVLDMVESALAYRKSLHDAEKEKKKLERKSKKRPSVLGYR